MAANFLYVTTRDSAEASQIAEQLLAERLIACANILPQMESLYWWKNDVAHDSEAVLIAKTDRRHLEAATARIAALHSYETPCVVALPIEGGHPGFLRWIEEETNAPQGE